MKTSQQGAECEIIREYFGRHVRRGSSGIAGAKVGLGLHRLRSLPFQRGRRNGVGRQAVCAFVSLGVHSSERQGRLSAVVLEEGVGGEWP